MDRYTVDGFILGDWSGLDREAEDRQWKMLEALDSILYYHFEEALAQNSAVFQLTLNGVDMECAYTVREGQLQYPLLELTTRSRSTMCSWLTWTRLTTLSWQTTSRKHGW